jgi:hypothetical protein
MIAMIMLLNACAPTQVLVKNCKDLAEGLEQCELIKKL